MSSSCLSKPNPVDRSLIVGSTGFGPQQIIKDRVRRTTGATASKKETPVPFDHWSLLRCCLAEKQTNSIAEPFYGVPAEKIAEWCCVSVQTAEHYKAGRRKPSVRVQKLFWLHRDGKVLGRCLGWLSPQEGPLVRT